MGEKVKQKETLDILELFRNDQITKRLVLTNPDGTAYDLTNVDTTYLAAKKNLADLDSAAIFIITGSFVSPKTSGKIDFAFTPTHTANAMDAWAELSLKENSPAWEKTVKQWHLKIWSDVRKGT